MARVLIVYTGGTIGMVRTSDGEPLRAGTLSQIQASLEFATKIPGITWDLMALPDLPAVDSSDVAAKHWLAMAAVVADHYAKFDGFVILHGTDTMAYSASALSFLLQNLGKPVVFTGAQLPLSDPRSDGRLNLINALHVAGWKATGLPLLPEVMLCFGTKLLRGNRSRKVSTEDLDGFDSPNFPPLGKLGDRIEIQAHAIRKRPSSKAKFTVYSKLETDVMDLTLFPGISGEAISKVVSLPELRGLVLRTFGTGNVMSDRHVLAAIWQATKTNKVALAVTQCERGLVDMEQYAAGQALSDLGVLPGLDLTPEAALTKLFWVLGNAKRASWRTLLQQDLCGEQSGGYWDAVPEALHAKVANQQWQRSTYLRPKWGADMVLRRAILYGNAIVPGQEVAVKGLVAIGTATGSREPIRIPVTELLRQQAVGGKRFVLQTRNLRPTRLQLFLWQEWF